MSSALLACLQLDWVTTTGKLLGRATCLSHKDVGIPLSVLPNDPTSKLAGLFLIQYCPFCAEHQAESYEYHFKVFDITRIGKLIPVLLTAKRTL